MNRTTSAATVAALILTASTVSAQGFSGSPVIPGSFPQVPIPGTFPAFPIPGTIPNPTPGVPGRGVIPPNRGGGWFGGGGFGFSPWYFAPGYYGSNYGPVYAPSDTDTAPAPVKPQLVPGNAFSATLTVQLPLSGELWVNGEKQEGVGDLFRITTTPIARGTEESFTVKATWTLDGKKYASERKVPLGSGDRVKLTIASGTPVEK